jgi:hypothetical protein
MDINPLIAQENNLMAVDVRIKIGWCGLKMTERAELVIEMGWADVVGLTDVVGLSWCSWAELM